MVTTGGAHTWRMLIRGCASVGVRSGVLGVQ